MLEWKMCLQTRSADLIEFAFTGKGGKTSWMNGFQRGLDTFMETPFADINPDGCVEPPCLEAVYL